MADASCKAIRDMHQRHHGNEKRNMKNVQIGDSKYPRPPSEIAVYQVTDPTICKSKCQVSNLWVFGYLNLLSNLLCRGGAA